MEAMEAMEAMPWLSPNGLQLGKVCDNVAKLSARPPDLQTSRPPETEKLWNSEKPKRPRDPSPGLDAKGTG